VNEWRQFALALPDMDAGDQKGITLAFDSAARLIRNSGVEEISGVGASAIALEPGLYHTKFMLHHYPGQGRGFLWSAFGRQPHALAALDLMPASTALGIYSEADLPQLWQVLAEELKRSGIPDIGPALDGFREKFLALTGASWERTLASLGGEYALVVTLDPARPVPFPMPGASQPMQFPEPGLLLIVRVKDDFLFNTWEKRLPGGEALLRVDEPDLKMRTIPVPSPVGIPLRPTLALSGGYLFFASTDALVREALAVRQGKKPGLKSTDEFKQLARHMPEQGNAFTFTSQRFSKLVTDAQQLAISTFSGGGGNPSAAAFSKLFTPGTAGMTYSVFANTEEGWLTMSNGNQEPARLLATSTFAASAGLMAAIAIPNFVKARETAQKNACTANQRQLEGATEQWALENKKRGTDRVDVAMVREYLRGGVLPTCPAGGTYSFTTVQERPTCSLPGHAVSR
jgi:hypothetical protein